MLAFAFYTLYYDTNQDIPKEWLNEDGSINFNKKFESETKNKQCFTKKSTKATKISVNHIYDIARN